MKRNTYPYQWKIRIGTKPLHNKNYTMIYFSILTEAFANLNKTAFCIWLYFYCYLRPSALPTPIYPKDIYEKLGISRTQYYEGFKELIKMGYIVPEDYLTFYARRQSPKLDQYYNQDYIIQGEKDYPCEGTKEIYCIFNNSTAMDIIKRLKSYPAIQLWFFFIANKQGYEFYLSPSYVKKQISLPESSYHKGIHVLIDNGFLVQQTQCYYIFEEEGNGDYQVFGDGQED